MIILVDVRSYIPRAGAVWAHHGAGRETCVTFNPTRPPVCVFHPGEYLNYRLNHLRHNNVSVLFPQTIIDSMNSTTSQITLVRDVVYNRTREPITTTLSFSREVEESTSTETTHGVVLGASVTTTASANVFFVEASMSATLSAEYNFSTTDTVTRSVSKTVGINRQIITAPGTRSEVSFITVKSEFSIPVTIECNVDLSADYLVRTTNAARETYWVGPMHTPIIVRDGNIPNFTGSRFRGTSTLSGSLFLDSYLLVDEIDLVTNQLTKRYIVPNSGSIVTLQQ